jgi:CRISPR/Cas system-associated exonuclease Cas4 (RecB family)
MANMSSVSSEEELLQLRNEGKITEDEYEDLRETLRKTTKPNTLPVLQDKVVPVRTSGLAIASLACSLLGPVCCIPAIICGHLALRRMGREPALRGYGLAIAGLIIGYIILGISIAVTVPNGMKISIKVL